MVVILSVIPIVVYSVFLLLLLLLVLTGAMVLLYCNTSYYVLRGGTSSDGVTHGAFSVVAASGAGAAYWNRGTALL